MSLKVQCPETENGTITPLLVETEYIQQKTTNIAVDSSRNTNSKQISPLLKQTFVVSGTMLQKMACGATLGYTAILLPALMEHDSAIQISDQVVSWILAISSIGSFIATFISPFFMRNYGRRSSIISSCILMLLAWTVLGTAQTSIALLVGRFIHGFSNGFQLVALSIYITESTSSDYRGFFLGTIGLSLAIGKWVPHLVGTFCDWRMNAFICSILSLAAIIIMFLSPESPNYYACKNQFETAKRSFIWLRGTSQKSREEMNIFINYKIKSNSTPKCHQSKGMFRTAFKVLKQKEVFKSWFIIYMVFIVNTSSMSDFLVMFIINILKTVLKNEKDSYAIMNIMDIVRVISAIIALIVIKKYSRRSIFFTSGAMTVISMLSLSLLAYLISESIITSSSTLLIGISMNILVVSMSIGTLPLTYVYAGELFPLAHKELGGFATSFCSGTSIFLMLKTSIFFSKILNTHGFFLLYSGVHLVSLIVTYYILPETKDKTLVELENNMD